VATSFCGNCGSPVSASYCTSCGTKTDAVGSANRAADHPTNADLESLAKQLVSRVSAAIDSILQIGLATPANKTAERRSAAAESDLPANADATPSGGSEFCTTLSETRAQQRWAIPVLTGACVLAVLFTFILPNLFMALIDIGAIWATVTFANSTKTVKAKDLHSDLSTLEEKLLHAHSASLEAGGLIGTSFLLLRLTDRRLLLGAVGRAQSFRLEDVSKLKTFADNGIRLEFAHRRKLKLCVPSSVRDSLTSSLRQHAPNLLTQ